MVQLRRLKASMHPQDASRTLPPSVPVFLPDFEAAVAFAEEERCFAMEVVSGDHRAEDAHRFYRAMGFEAHKTRFYRELSS